MINLLPNLTHRVIDLALHECQLEGEFCFKESSNISVCLIEDCLNTTEGFMQHCLMSTKGGEDSEVDSASDPDSEEVSSKTRDRPLTYESYTKALADARKHGRKAKNSKKGMQPWQKWCSQTKNSGNVALMRWTESSEQRGEEGDERVVLVKPLLCRGEKVNKFFKQLDQKIAAERTPQARRQLMRRVVASDPSARTAPVEDNLPPWLFNE
ncbi:hypothetical protein GBAR_LOCUS3312 [Geodia barretti]|uniref:Uncharacterized protein n=1 Tax=Geodia barretti TaxID=519541 RepID=A0AA35W4I9_GEOBA|nr:hypothetical protein GBAR_LOCUS3312 [Geodia barretti]